jgi:hypothetical protein
MLRAYRSLLYLYPPGYRREFGAEMTAVFLDAQRAIDTQSFRARTVFCTRELTGLVTGALRQHFELFIGPPDSDVLRRFAMRPEFRFPRSAITLMLIILAGVILTIEKAAEITMKYSGPVVTMWSTFWSFVVLAFLLVSVAAAGGWAVLYALKRSGVHRLSDVHTWPDQGD